MFFLFDPAIRALLQKWFSDVCRDVMLQYLSLLPAHWFARHCMIWKVAPMIRCLKRMDSPSQQFTSAFGDLGCRFFIDFSRCLQSQFCTSRAKKNIFGHFWLVQTDTNTWHMDPRNVSMWSSCCWSSARRRYHSGKVEARKACCHRSPLWTPGRWKPLVEYQCNLFLMVPRKLIWCFHERLAKELEKRRYLSRKVCKRSWPKHAKTWWFPNSLSLTI